MYKKNFSIGIFLIIIGVLSLLNKVLDLNLFSLSNLWPLFILVPGLLFEISYFSKRLEPGFLVPGGILTTVGLLFLFQTLTNWELIEYSWPIFPLSVAIGLFQLYIFGRKEKTLLIPILILSSISIISWASMFLSGLFSWIDKGLIFPVILIIIGAFLLLNNLKKR